MAFSLRVTVNPKETNSPEDFVEPDWWNQDELLSNYNFKSYFDGAYQDLKLIVNKEELIKIFEKEDRQFKSSTSYEFTKEFVIEERKKLKNLIENMDSNSIAEIWIYEWETGLD